MGCDIHLRTEVRRNGTWEPAVPQPDDCGRNYDAFAILANVRNGSGFAGCELGEQFKPISYPRGLPDDIARHEETFEDEEGGVYFGDHSHSWVTLAELEAVSWERVTIKSGVLRGPQFEQWDAAGGGRPANGWAGGISGRDIREVMNDEMRQAIAEARDVSNLVTRVRWPETYAWCAGSLYSLLLPELRALGLPPDDVRIVFGFDS